MELISQELRQLSRFVTADFLDSNQQTLGDRALHKLLFISAGARSSIPNFTAGHNASPFWPHQKKPDSHQQLLGVAAPAIKRLAK